MNFSMSNVLAIFFILGHCAPEALADGGVSGGGGGDPCEEKIQSVRDEIKDWIHKDGPKSLELPSGLSREKYAHDMQDAMATTKIRCVKPGDPGYPVSVGGTPKVCRFDKRPQGTSITCDAQSFVGPRALNEAEQYRLIHHEYAGIAGFEPPNGDVSTYTISNQLVADPGRKVSAKFQFMGKTITLPFGPLKYSDGQRFIHYHASVSQNCEVEFEIVTSVDKSTGKRKLTIFSWLFQKDRESKQPPFDSTFPATESYREAWRQFREQEKHACGRKASDSLYTAHLAFPDKAFLDMSLDSDIFGHGDDLPVDGVNLGSERVKVTFEETREPPARVRQEGSANDGDPAPLLTSPAK